MSKATFTIPRKRLLEAVRRAHLASARQSHRPILQSAKLSVNGHVSLAATDQEFAFVEMLDAEHEGRADILVAPNLLKEALTRTKDDSVRIEIQHDSSLTIVGSKAQVMLPCAATPADDFPVIGTVDEIVGYVKGADLARALRQTLPFTDEASSRYALGGVLFEVGDETLTLVSTDTRRLSVVRIPYIPFKGVVIARSGVIFGKLLRSVLKHAEAHPAVEFRMSDTAASFGFDGCVAFARQIEGRFPAWRDVMPENNNHRVEFAVSTMREALDAVLPAVTVESKGCEFGFGNQQITLQCGIEGASVARSSCPVLSESSGDVGVSSIVLDAEFVQEYLASLPKHIERVTLAMLEDVTPVMFLAEGEAQHVLMPLVSDERHAAHEARQDAAKEFAETQTSLDSADAEPFSPLHVVRGARCTVDFFARLTDTRLERSDPSDRRNAANLIRTMRGTPLGRNALRSKMAELQVA